MTSELKVKWIPDWAVKPLCLPLCPSVCLHTCLSVGVPACLSVCLSICQPTYQIPAYLSFCMSVCLTVCLPTRLPAGLPAFLLVCLSLSLSVSLYTSCMSVCIQPYLSVCLTLCIPPYLSVYLIPLVKTKKSFLRLIFCIDGMRVKTSLFMSNRRQSTHSDTWYATLRITLHAADCRLCWVSQLTTLMLSVDMQRIKRTRFQL
jgi:hypothetical protein